MSPLSFGKRFAYSLLSSLIVAVAGWIKSSQTGTNSNKMDLKAKLKPLTPTLLLTTFVATFGSSLLMGYNIGVLNSPTKVIISFYNVTFWARRGGEALDGWVLQLLWAVTVSIFVCAGMLGALSCGLIADYFGRKRALLFNCTFMFAGTLLEGLAKPCAAPELLILGRGLVGYNCGMTVGLASLYLTEISPKATRGAVASCHQLAVTLGILTAQILGLREILGTDWGWPILCAVAAFPAVVSTMALPFCPESPRYLLLKRGNEVQARTALQKLRAMDNVSSEIEEMAREAKRTQTKAEPFTLSQLLKSRDLRLPLVVAIMMQIAQQWSGINAIFFYSESIFEGAGVASHHIPYAIVGTGTVNVIATSVSVLLVENLGRRKLLIGPMILMAVSTVVITISLNLQSIFEWMAYISILCIVLFIIGFALGLGSIPPMLCAEMFRQEPRPAAMALSQGVNWTCNFLLAISFKYIEAGLQAYTFLVFLIVLIICIIFIFFLVPETKNRTFDEIARDLELGVNKVKRSLSRQSTSVLLTPDGNPSSSRFTTPSSTPATTPGESVEIIGFRKYDGFPSAAHNAARRLSVF